MTTRLSEQAIVRDPVVVYDTMREAASRLSGRYIALARQLDETDSNRLVLRSHAIMVEANAVNPDDMGAQDAARARFNAEFTTLPTPRR